MSELHGFEMAKISDEVLFEELCLDLFKNNPYSSTPIFLYVFIEDGFANGKLIALTVGYGSDHIMRLQ